MNTSRHQALKLSSQNRFAAVALALLFTLGMLLSVDRLASTDSPAPRLAQAGSARA